MQDTAGLIALDPLMAKFPQARSNEHLPIAVSRIYTSIVSKFEVWMLNVTVDVHFVLFYPTK